MTYKKYEDDFKRKIVNLHLSGHSVADLSNAHKISNTAIYSWIKIYGKSETTKQQINLEMSKENERLKKEVAILKQAMTILSSK
ncbi:transposase [Solibacillus sp. FSL K6-1126]|uniref:transposase n=1 Tax=Solibacillus sp. FSL K6-1126 TaxID=2921463 RepID=UPI0030F9EF97